MSRMHDEVEDNDVVFFRKSDPVNIQIWYDEKEGVFVAVAQLSSTEEKLFEAEAEELHEATDAILDRLQIMCDDPNIMNDRLKSISMGLRKPEKKSKIVKLR